MEGVFISFEGVEGSGKSTQAAMLYDYIISKGNEALFIREPGGTPIGEQIRAVLLDVNNKGMDFYAESCLYAAARAQLVSGVIKPALLSGKVVICDRFVDSSYAYQAFARGLGYETVFELNRPAVAGAVPHITVLIDVNVQEGLKRRSKSGKVDRLDMESLAFHRKVYEAYNFLLEKFPERFMLVDGEGSANEVFSRLIYKLKERLNCTKKEVIL